jgi:hypothetical protein
MAVIDCNNNLEKVVDSRNAKSRNSKLGICEKRF